MGAEQKRGDAGWLRGQTTRRRIIGVQTGALNAGSGAPTGDQSTDMNGTRGAPPMCQDPMRMKSRELILATRRLLCRNQLVTKSSQPCGES
jgi:hypothetical protein